MIGRRDRHKRMRGLRAFGPVVGKPAERFVDLPEPLHRHLLAMIVVALEDDDDPEAEIAT